MKVLLLNTEFGNVIKFDVKCKSCGSENVVLKIDWTKEPSATSNTVMLECLNCNTKEVASEFLNGITE